MIVDINVYYKNYMTMTQVNKIKNFYVQTLYVDYKDLPESMFYLFLLQKIATFWF